MGIAKKEDGGEDRKQTTDTENALGLLVKVENKKDEEKLDQNLLQCKISKYMYNIIIKNIV